MVNPFKKGKYYELELAKRLRAMGWAVCRAAGSGRSGRSSAWRAPDIIAAKIIDDVTTVMAIEVKASLMSKCVNFPKEEYDVLMEWKQRANAISVVAIRVYGGIYYFVPIHKISCAEKTCKACIHDAWHILGKDGWDHGLREAD